MEVSIWWVVAAAALGLCAGLLLFAVLTMAADRNVEAYPEAQGPTQPVV